MLADGVGEYDTDVVGDFGGIGNDGLIECDVGSGILGVSVGLY